MKPRILIAIAGLAVFLASWIAVAVGYALGVDKSTWVLLVVIAACATEALVWCVAFVLGLSLVAARSRIWQWLKKPFRRSRNVDVTDP